MQLIYTDSALGGESDLIEQVRGGSTEACMQMGAANFEGINAEVNVALLPFLFTSLDNARNAWGGDFGAQFAEKLIEPMGFKVLSIWESGYRHMTNNTRPLEKPEDRSEGNQVPHQREQHEGRHVRRTGRFHRHHGLL